MAPWWKRHAKRNTPCERCGSIEDVHRSFCRKCRAELSSQETRGGQGVRIPPVEGTKPPAPDLEPPHDRPWVHRGGG